MIRTLVSVAALACALGAATPALAGGSPNDLLCKYEQDTGSHLKKRVCTTRAVREEQQKAARETMARAGANQDNRAAMSRAQNSPSAR